MRDRTVVALLALFLTWPTASVGDTLPPGSWVGKGLSLDVTSLMGNRLSAQVASLIPPDLIVPEIPVTVACPLDCSSQLSLRMQGGSLELVMADATLRTEEGILWLDTVLDARLMPGASLTLGDGSPLACDPYSPCCWQDACPTGTCDLSSDWISFHYSVGLSFDIQDADGPGGDPPDYAYTVHGPVHDIEAVLDQAVFTSDCGLDGDLQHWMLQNLGAGVGSLLAPALLQMAEQDLPGQLSMVGALWGLLNLDDVLDVLGSQLHYSMYVSGVTVADGGLRLDLDTLLEASDPSACIEPFDPGGFPFTPNAQPSFVTTIPGTALDYDAGIVLSDDLAGQLAYAAWRSGALCAVIDEELIGFPLDSSMVGAGLGDEVSSAMSRVLLGENSPMELHLLPTKVPLALVTGPHDLTLALKDLEMRFVATVLGRKTVLFAVQVDMDLNLDIGATVHGELDVEIGLDTTHLNTRLVSNELMPEAGEALHRAFPDFFLGLLDTAGGALMGHLYLGPLVFSEVGPVEGISRTRGEANDYREIFARMDTPVPGQSEGGMACSACDLTSCTDPSSCDGCATASPQALLPLAWMALLPLLFLIYLRRD